LAEPARLRILQLLREESMCGRELAGELNLSPATTCHHLERLKLANLLSERRSGKHVYYSVSNSELARAVRRSLAAVSDEKPPANGKQTQRGPVRRQPKRRNDRPRRGRR
jgi:DNA-binding transcriptional ArsR family regulator